MTNLNDERIVDRIYEAAVLTSEWTNVLDIFSDRITSIGGLLFTANQHRTSFVVSPRLQALNAKMIEAGWGERNTRVARVTERGLVGTTITDHDLFDEAELEHEPLYKHLRANGGGWCVGHMIDVPSGDKVVVTFERAWAHGPFGRGVVADLDRFRPHIARAAMLAGRIALDRARAGVEALGLIGLPAGVISLTNKLAVANKLLSDLVPSVVMDGRDRVRLANRRADSGLVAMLARLRDGQRLAQPLSIPVPRDDDDPIVLHLVPVCGSAQDVFSGAACLLAATAVGRTAAPSVDVIKGLFDLSGAEARVARFIVAGGTLGQLAGETGVSVGTLRLQLKAVFAKTGLHRQSDLVAALSGKTLPHGTR